MELPVLDVVFYAFAAILLLCALMVVTSRNPVYSVFFLILAFFNAAALFVLLGAEYIAMTLVIVYVGAVAVLFLFVVMMLNINFAQMRTGFSRYLPLGLAGAVLLFIELAAVMYVSSGGPLPGIVAADAIQPIPNPDLVTNTQAIGNVLYTDYIYLFQLAGLILLVAMIGAIVLTHRERKGVRKQNISKQVNRTRDESIVMVDIKPGEGA